MADSVASNEWGIAEAFKTLEQLTDGSSAAVGAMRFLRGEIERQQRQIEELSIHAEKWVKRALGSAPEPGPRPPCGISGCDGLAMICLQHVPAPEPPVDESTRQCAEAWNVIFGDLMHGIPDFWTATVDTEKKTGLDRVRMHLRRLMARAAQPPRDGQ